MKRVNEEIDYIKINLASPERIQEWGERILPNGQIVGEVTKSDTLNYRTLKPEINGLFCEKIFGPFKDWECHCGKYKKERRQGFVCENCGVDLTESRVRRYRMGYINLSTPVTHVWYLKGLPSYLSHVLGKSLKEVEKIIYLYESVDDIDLGLDETFSYTNDDDFFLEKESQKVGAEVIYNLLKNIDLVKEISICRKTMDYSKSKIKIKSAIKRIRILESFLSTNSKLEWMVLTVLPVLPPSLRPLSPLESGAFANSDLNVLYKRVIDRNNRFKKLKQKHAPDIVLRDGIRLLQEAVDTLIDNGKRGPKEPGLNRQPLKSLADTIQGKQGRFRQNLLGKRVDYSGRSVIVVGPSLDLNQCGLPYEMALELFYPFLVHKLITQGLVSTIRNARKFLQSNDMFLWDFVKDVIQGHPILLNRAPTLHRLGVQAFEPVLVRGRAIQLHPLVCPAFNADFDGDQMAVHIPLSLEAQIEARILMIATNNFLSPATGEPIIQPTQDMLLGCYYLSLNNRSNLKGSSHYFSSFDDAVFAYEHKQINLHSSVWIRCPEKYKFTDELEVVKSINLKDESKLTFYKNLQVKESKTGEFICQYVRTTPGRIIFNKTLNTIENI
jgi:DNA-directed RNA polymerase subunit beta'